MATKKQSQPLPTNCQLDADAQRLLDAVLAAPDDFAARLVFSDWLTERGDPRGEFIQLQCALGRPLHGAKGRAWDRPLFDGDPAELEKRERKLLKLYEKQWLAAIRPFVRTWVWHWGFVKSLVADAAKFVEGAEAIFGATPVVEVQLTGFRRPLLRQLAQQPTTARLRSLNASFQKFSADDLVAFQSPHWRGLRVLNLAGNRFGVAGAAALAQVNTLDTLETLLLNDAQLDDACLVHLAKAPFFSKLKVLELGWNEQVTAVGCRAVLAAGTSLEALKLRRTGLVEADLTTLAPHRPSLQELRLSPELTSRAQSLWPNVVVRD